MPDTRTPCGVVEHRDIGDDGPSLVLLTGFGATIGHWGTVCCSPTRPARAAEILRWTA